MKVLLAAALVAVFGFSCLRAQESSSQAAPSPSASTQPSSAPASMAGSPGTASMSAAPKIRVFMQSQSHGNNWNARRDQSMEMSKDFENDCPAVRITLNQQNADYTISLNHIEVGVFGRDNQVQVADRNGDLLTRTKEGGSIKNAMKKACALIMEDYAKNPPAQK